MIEPDDKGFFHMEGVKIPPVGFGTYPLKSEACSDALKQAIKKGYRIIDTATFYSNFAPIGDVLKNKRHQFYVISKVWLDAHTPNRLKNDLQKTLQELQTDYIDAYLLHWPNSKVPIRETLRAMEELRVKGLIRHIGLSNVTENHLKRALEEGVPITWVQVEMHPHFYDQKLLSFCKAHSIKVQAWAPLGRGRLS